DNKTIILPGEDGLDFWDVSAEGPFKRRTLDQTDPATSSCAAVSQDGTTLVMLTQNTAGTLMKGVKVKGVMPAVDPPRAHLTLWDPRVFTPGTQMELPGAGTVSDIALAPDGRAVAVVRTNPPSGDKALELWDRGAVQLRLKASIPLNMRSISGLLH